MDLIAAVIAFFSVRKSAEPPDAAHLFGHGKFEDISGLIEALLIFVAAILIIREALLKLLGGPSEHFTPELLIMVSPSWVFRHWLTGMFPTAHEGGETIGGLLRLKVMLGIYGRMCILQSV